MFECRGHLLIATRRASPEKKDVEKITRRLLTTPFPLFITFEIFEAI